MGNCMECKHRLHQKIFFLKKQDTNKQINKVINSNHSLQN